MVQASHAEVSSITCSIAYIAFHCQCLVIFKPRHCCDCLHCRGRRASVGGRKPSSSNWSLGKASGVLGVRGVESLNPSSADEFRAQHEESVWHHYGRASLRSPKKPFRRRRCSGPTVFQFAPLIVLPSV